MIPNGKIAEEMRKWVKEQQEWLVEKGWEIIKERVKQIAEIDREIIAERELIPTLHIPFLCHHEKQIGWAIAPLTIPAEVIRENFGEIWSRIVAEISLGKCPRCGHRLLPLGYIYCSEAWVVHSPTLIDIPPSEHPDRKEMYVVLVNTIFGKLATAQAPITNRKVGELEWCEDIRAKGNLVLPLPTLEEFERWLKDQAESERKMYG
jgi:hypothetical protein